MNGNLIYRDETTEHSTNRYSDSYDCGDRFPNGDEEQLRAQSSLVSPGNYDMTRKSLVLDQEEYAASQTTEAILAEIFGKNTQNFRQKYSYGDHASGHLKESYDGAEAFSRRNNSSFKIEPSLVGNIRHRSTNSYGEKTAKNFSTEKSSHEIEEFISSVNSIGNDTLYDTFSTDKNELFNAPGAKVSNDLYDSHLGGDRITNEDSDILRGSVNTTAVNTSKQITSSSASNRSSLVQSNVVDYYERLKSEGKEWKEERILERMNSRKGVRSKSSEIPLRNDDHSFSLSKSWESTRSRKEFQLLNGDDGKVTYKMTDISPEEKIKQMFRMEEEICLRRAQKFHKLKLLQKVFLAWQRRSQLLIIKADKLCRSHLLQKGIKGLMFAVEHQKISIGSFAGKQERVLVLKCWRLWQQKTRERRRKKMQETFSQWRFYRLHVERTKLLESIANRHFLSKNYSKWKARFSSKQKHSLANVHFQINLIYKYWNCWTVYVKERRVKNRLTSIARYHYGEKVQYHLFEYWKSITQKSLFSRRLTRRRVLLKFFFNWKHWTQYAKIVHLRLQNMCKEYHKKTLTRRMFRKWKEARRMKLAIDFCRKTQQRRAIKLWNLRYMRKRLHKHLCKAVARSARKRRFFVKWMNFVKQQKESREECMSILQHVYIRVVFHCWRNKTTARIQMRRSMQCFQQERLHRLVQKNWESWKFQLKILERRRRSRNNWSLRCVTKCYNVWKMKVKKTQLRVKLHESCPGFEILFVKRYFVCWLLELKKIRAEDRRVQNAARILQRSKLGRILQAWRVVNQEECIIEPLIKKRVRRDTAKAFDAWRRYILRGTGLRRFLKIKDDRSRQSAWRTWSLKLWCRNKEREVLEKLSFSKLARHFFSWLELVKDIRESERIAEKRKESLIRKFAQTWRINTKQRVEIRESENALKARRRIILGVYFNSWLRKASKHAQTMTSLVKSADEAGKEMVMKRSFFRWRRQYSVELKAREYIRSTQREMLRIIFSAWKDFSKTELERKVCDFATNLAMESSQGSAFLSTSGYQTSLKNSSSSLPFLAADEEIFSPVPTPRSRPVTPTLSFGDTSTPRPFAILPSYRPVTIDSPYQHSGPRASPSLSRQHSLEQILTPQRSSEDDGVLSSGVHSAGDDSDQDDRTSIHITESLYSYQSTCDSVVRDRELLVTETIIHWRSLSLSVAFRSWFKYTQHMNHVRMTYTEWMVRDRERLVTKYLSKWRRWLFISVLARQHWVNQVKKKVLSQWIDYRKQQMHGIRCKEEANDFSKRRLLKKFYDIWKQKRTAKCQLQNIVLRWQRSVKVTDMDKQVIEQYKLADRVHCLRKTFNYWKKATRFSQKATFAYQTSLSRRCFLAWRDVSSFRAEHRKRMESFRTKRVLAKAFKEWLSCYEDVRTARIIIGVSEERRIDRIFKAWHNWAAATRNRRKISYDYHHSHEKRKLREKFQFWSATSKECIKMREHYQKTLQRKVLRSWRSVLMHKSTAATSIHEFQNIVMKNLLRSTFIFWRTRVRNNQIMLEYSKLKEKQHLALAFNRWKQKKRQKDANKHFSQSLMKKSFMCWCKQILKRKKARQHFKFWQTKAEGSKELNQVADTLVYDSENRLLENKFMLWRKLTKHSQVAKYHHETKMTRRHFLGWFNLFHKEKILQNKLKEFQCLHHRNDSGLLVKYMKIWLNKSTFSTKADNLYHETLYSRYWKLWRHSFVRRRVSLAMVQHDNQKMLSEIFNAWFIVSSSHKNLSKEIKTFRLRRWFRRWMTRYNNS
ncbi:uncharacterized protein LOC114518104 [Dendronephthya gigantea]|uniref:uncharacterized protein LOC114518104 n=1 Tax=Dendronephthya gigantea TaxID=151771 RepID=UPI001069A42C|nr:uncharacterized protein LOC114518104 [Dendronephthya gigantea]